MDRIPSTTARCLALHVFYKLQHAELAGTFDWFAIADSPAEPEISATAAVSID